MSPNNILIRIGAEDMYSVSNVSVHEEYDPSRPWENDIAIIELKKTRSIPSKRVTSISSVCSYGRQ